MESDRLDTRHGGGKHSEHIQQLEPDAKGYALPQGRWPANLIHDGSQMVLDLFPESKGQRQEKSSDYNTNGSTSFDSMRGNRGVRGYSESGSAARFFYCAKASRSERNEGCEELEEIRESDRIKDDGVGGDNPRNRSNRSNRNHHPTVKPISLMEYLVKLVSREGSTVLDPFLGSGSTGIACINLNRSFIGIEREQQYLDIATKRIENAIGKH